MSKRHKGDIHAARVLGMVIAQALDLNMIGDTGAAALEALGNPDSCWGLHPINLQQAVRQALRPRRFEKERSCYTQGVDDADTE